CDLLPRYAVDYARVRSLAAPVGVALEGGAVGVAEALEIADPFVTHEACGALGRVGTGLACHLRGVRRRQTAVDQLGFRGARSGHAFLPRHAVAIGGALVAAFAVDAADLVAGALAVVRTLRLVCQLTHAVRRRGEHAALPRRAVAIVLALRVTALKRAYQR